MRDAVPPGAEKPGPAGPAEAPTRPPVAWGLLAAVGAARLVLWAASIGPQAYGFMSDEYYYLDCARRLGWGYVDHPPLSVALLAAWVAAFGDALPTLRLLPALAHVGAVVVCALLARELGGGRAAQGLTALAVLVFPVYLGVTSFHSMNAFEPVLWAGCGLVLARIANGARPSTWLLLGVLLGLGLLNKISVLWLGLGLAVGLVATAQRRWLATPWPWAAAALAFALASPYAVWLAANDWPLLEFMRNATASKMVEKSLAAFAAEQVLVTNPLIVPLWGAGLVFYFTPAGGEAGRRHRWLGGAWVVVLALLAASGTTRSNYSGPAYTLLLPAGAVVFERLAGRPGLRRLPAVAAVAIAVGGALTAPLALPLLPPERLVAYQRALGVTAPRDETEPHGALPLHFALRHGWADIRRAVHEALDTLTPAERERAVLLGEWFGDTGMLNHHREREGFPPAVSGHNHYWLWGPGDASGEILVALDEDGERLRRWYARVERVAEVDCTWCMPDVARLGAYVCREPRRPIREWWPEARRFI